jgi:hypothetical protein
LLAAATALALAPACNSDEDSIERIALGGIELAPPAGWQVQELGATTRVWSPEKNPRKETITVIVGPTFLGTAERALRQTRAAQGVLHGGQLVRSTPLTTLGGLPGLQLDLRFRPETAPTRTYDRSHVVLVVDDHTVHVLYTALDPDPGRVALGRVLDSIKRGG